MISHSIDWHQFLRMKFFWNSRCEAFIQDVFQAFCSIVENSEVAFLRYSEKTRLDVTIWSYQLSPGQTESQIVPSSDKLNLRWFLKKKKKNISKQTYRVQVSFANSRLMAVTQLTLTFYLDQSERKSTQVHASPGQTSRK